jgi:hypothetical protein
MRLERSESWTSFFMTVAKIADRVIEAACLPTLATERTKGVRVAQQISTMHFLRPQDLHRGKCR